jgi:hypothetical protein
MGILRGVVRLIVGVIFGAASALALSPAVAAFTDSSGSNAWLFFLVIGAGALLGVFAPNIRRAFGRGFLLLGASVFALPLSTLLLSGRVASDMAAQSDDRRSGIYRLFPRCDSPDYRTGTCAWRAT